MGEENGVDLECVLFASVLSLQVSFDEVRIYKIGASSLPESCLPLGQKPDEHKTKIVPANPSPQLQHHLLAVSQCEDPDEDLLRTNVVGFICVTEVKMEERTMLVLSPQAHPLPRTILLWSEVTFLDDRF